MDNYITLAHGGGGDDTNKLIKQEILEIIGFNDIENLPDAASLSTDSNQILFSTDSFVVNPIFFPGGNIGDLCVHGTVNDISVSGGKPLWLSLGMIIEEGFSITEFRKIITSIKKAASYCDVKIVTGDTKVVERGKCDGIYINTSGIGVKYKEFDLGVESIEEGDSIIISGGIAEHGFAIMSSRSNIAIENGPKSDSAPVNHIISAIKDFGKDVKFMRDPTRGGVSAVLNEITDNNSFGVLLNEEKIPMNNKVKAVSDLLGLDPMQAACEGRVIIICRASSANAILNKIKSVTEGKNAAVIGEIINKPGKVILQTITGGKRLIDRPKGELLPRIC